jgi:hypothetical protein
MNRSAIQFSGTMLSIQRWNITGKQLRYSPDNPIGMWWAPRYVDGGYTCGITDAFDLRWIGIGSG